MNFNANFGKTVRSNTSSNSDFISRSAVCVGDKPRSYVPAPAGGWKWGTCLQVSQLFWEHWFHQVALNCCIFIHSISLQALKLRVFRSNTESNLEICRLQKCCVCVCR